MRGIEIGLAALIALGQGWALAGEEAPASQGAPAEPAKQPIPEPTRFATHHVGRFGSETVRYAATAGETYLRDDAGEPTASLFSFAYVREGVEDSGGRPVTFVWNGGPGSSSVWLHMGTLGPQRVAVPSDARSAGAPPFPVEANQETLLDVTDLVFVDPVGTGFSHGLGAHVDEEFWGLDQDAASIARFVRTWITEQGRWSSPKFLVGESFGTTRAAAVAELLESGAEGVSLNGLVLISQALDYTGSTPKLDNLISFLTYLPTMAATAWYHQRAADPPETLEPFLEEARAFAVTEYAPALLQGSRLDAEARERVRRGLARFTGLPEDYLERSELRVVAWRFLKELLRDQGVSLGRLDARYTGDDADDAAELPDGDPASDAITGAYTAALHDYMARELNVKMERRYRISGHRQMGGKWKWRPAGETGEWEPSYVDVARRLGRAMRRNPELRVLVASGYYDFATPFFDAEYTFARNGIVSDRVEMTYYEAGHMMYVHDPSRTTLLRDMRAFYAAALR